MVIEQGVGLGLYVSGVVLMVRTLEEKFVKDKRKRGTARVASIITLIFMGVMFMMQGT